MVTAISSSIASLSGVGISGARQSVGLDAQLAQCQRQLGDWTACASAKTPEGRAKIEELSSQIGQIKAEMQKAAQATPNPLPYTPAASTDPIAGSAGPSLGLGTGRILDEYA